MTDKSLVSTAEAGLSRETLVRIVLHTIVANGGAAQMKNIYKAVEEQLQGAKLSYQGEASLRELVNRHAVRKGFVYKHDKKNPGWRITPAGRQYLLDFDTKLGTSIDSRTRISPNPREPERPSSQLPSQPPTNFLVLEANLEDASMDGIEGIKVLRRAPSGGKVSRQTLEQARNNAQITGRLGEEFVFRYLELKKEAKSVHDFTWEADDNAIAPFDFKIEEFDHSFTLIDVKSTKGDFNNRIHISYSELLQMKDAERYDLYRIYEINDKCAQLRIATNLKNFAQTIIDIFDKLPAGIQLDSISLSPSKLSFGEVIEITL